MLKKSQSTKGAPLGGRRGSEKKNFFRQKFLDSIKISYEKFRFDATSLTHQNADFPPPPSKAAPPGGLEKKFFFRQNYRDSIKISYGKFRFDATSSTPQNVDSTLPLVRQHHQGGVEKKNFFRQMKRNAKKIIHENFGGSAAIFNTPEYSLTHKSSK